MRAFIRIATVLGVLAATGCLKPATIGRPVPTGAATRADSTFAQLCAKPPRTTRGGVLGCLLRYQVF
jgi:hypothetical protein